MHRRHFSVWIAVAWIAIASMGDKVGAADLETRRWTVDGQVREGLVHVPDEKFRDSPPLVFGFHGHGGKAVNVARSYGLHVLWPEAVVVYLQGLPTVGRFDPEGTRSGWQKTIGDQADRDLRLFDAVFDSVKREHGIDPNRVYVTGHSNGGGFTYLLWAARGDVLTAVAPSAAGARNVLDIRKPLPCLHIAGKRDEVVPFATQQRALEGVRRINRCQPSGQVWEDDPRCTLFPSAVSAPVVSFIHDGDHQYPKEAPSLIVAFFKQHQRPDRSAHATEADPTLPD